jgi:hypothetical protein
MNEAAARNSAPNDFQLDNFLRQELPLPFVQGVATVFDIAKAKTVINWIQASIWGQPLKIELQGGKGAPWRGRCGLRTRAPSTM